MPELNTAALALAKRAWETIILPHELRPGPHTRLALGAALRILGRIQSSGGGWLGSQSGLHREIDELREVEADNPFKEGFAPAGGGGEHLTFSAVPPDGTMYKATWGRQYGFVPDWTAHDSLELRPASPSEYLLRCGLANAVFGDNISLLGVYDDLVGGYGTPSIVTTQPFIVGEPPKMEEVVAFFKAQDFVSLTDLVPHRPEVEDQIWYRAKDQVLVADARPGNFIRSRDGVIVAIDLPATLVALDPP